MKEIERIINKKFTIGDMPTGKEICEQQLIKVIDDIEKVKVNEEEIEAFLPGIYRKLEWLSKEDLLKRVVSMEFNRFLEYYSNAPEIETPSKKDHQDADKENKRKNHGSDKEKTSRKAEEGYARLFLNMGKSDGFFATQIIDMINRNTKRVEIGRIDLMQNFSFFEVLEDQADEVIKALNKVRIKGRKVVVELAGENNGNSDKSGKKRGRKEDAPKKERKSDKAPKASKAEKEPKKEKKAKPSREERGYTEARGPKKKDDWKQFFAPENSKWLKGEKPDFEEEGWARRKPKKK